MSKNADQIVAIDLAILELRKQKVAIEEAEFKNDILPRMKANVGKCSKYRNCYSCPSKASDYWWMYVRIVAVEDGSYVVQRFQRDSYGKASMDPPR